MCVCIVYIIVGSSLKSSRKKQQKKNSYLPAATPYDASSSSSAQQVVVVLTRSRPPPSRNGGSSSSFPKIAKYLCETDRHMHNNVVVVSFTLPILSSRSSGEGNHELICFLHNLTERVFVLFVLFTSRTRTCSPFAGHSQFPV